MAACGGVQWTQIDKNWPWGNVPPDQTILLMSDTPYIYTIYYDKYLLSFVVP